MAAPTTLPEALAEIEELRGQVRDLLQLLGQEAKPSAAGVGASPVKRTDAHEFSEGLVPKLEGKEAAQHLLDLHQMIEAVPDIIFTLDLQGNLVGWNRRLQVVTGFTPQELNGRPALAFVPEDEHAQTAAAIQRVFEEGYAELEGHLLTKAQLTIPYHWTGATLKNEVGRVIGITGVGRDVSDKRQTQLELQRQRQQLLSAQALAHVGSWEWEIASGDMEWSEEQFRIFGHEPGTIPISYEAFLAAVLPDDHDRVRTRISKTLMEQNPLDIECRIVRPTGEIRSIHCRGEITLDHAGRPACMSGSTLDITDRKRSESALQQSEAHFRALIENSSDIITVLDPDGTIRFESPSFERLLGYTQHEIDGRIAFDFIHPDDLPMVLQKFQQVVQQLGESQTAEFRFRHKDGSWRNFEGIGRAAVDAKGQLCVIANSRDISERKRSEEELIRSHELLTSFVEHTPAAVAMLDKDLRYVAVSRRWIQDYRLDEQDLTGKHHYDIFPEIRSNEAWQEVHRRCLGGAVERRDEDRFVRTDGSEDWLKWEVRPWEDITGDIGGIIMFTEVITERKRAEQALRTSEERYARATAIGKVGVWELDVARELYHADINLKSLFGYGPDELSTDPYVWLGIVHPEDQSIALKAWEGIVSGSTDDYHYELRMIRKDGTIIWTEVRGHAERDAYGHMQRLIGATVDITERKQADAALRISQMKLRQTLQASNTGLWDWNTATNEVVFSPEWKRQLGYEDDEIAECFEEWESRLHPEDRERALTYARAYREEPKGDYTQEFRLRHKDGSYRWITARASFVTDSDGRHVCLLGSHVDITDRKQAELGLQRSEAHFRALIEHSSDIITVLELDGTIRFESPSLERLLGFAQHEIDGLIAFDFIHPDDLPTVLEKFQLVVQRPGEAQTAEFRFRHKDGSWLPLEGIGRSILDPEGHRCVIVNSRDVTERKRVEDALAQRSLQQQVVAEFGEFVLREREVQSLMDQAVQRIAQTLHTEYCKILELQPGGTSLLLRAGVGWHDGLVGRATVNAGPESQAGHTLNSNEPIIVEDMRTERRFNGPPLLFDHGVVSGLSVIIRRERQPWGVLGIHTSTQRSFTQDDVNFVQSMANILGTIIERNLAEEAARRNHVLLSAIMDASIDHISVKDLDGRYIHMNQAGANTLRMPIDEIIGWDDIALWGSESAASLRAGDRLAVESGETITLEESLRGEGEATVYLTTKAPYRDPQGRIIGIIAVARDITEQKRVEQERQQALTLLRNVINATPDLIFAKDRELRTILCNDAFAHAIGKRSTEIIGHTDIENGWDPELVHGHPDKGIRGFEADDRQALNGQIVHNPADPANVMGEVRIFDTVKVPLRSDSGEIMGMLGISRDITARVETELALKQSEVRLKDAQRLAHIGSWELDLKRNCLTWSDEIFRIFEIDQDRFGASYEAFLALVHPDDQSAVDRAYSDSVRNRTSYEITHRLLMPDGRVKYVHEQCETLYDAHGAPRRSFGTVQDVTERMRLADRDAARLEQLKNLSELGLTLSGNPTEIFERVVRMIGNLFHVRVVCLSEIVGETLQFKAVYHDGRVVRDAGQCPLIVTPCATVCLDKEIRLFDHVQEQFPEATFLRDYQAVSYCGFPALDAQGQVVAVTCLLDDKPREFTAEEQALLQVFGQRIAVEIERGRLMARQKQDSEELRQSHAFIRQIIDTDPNFVFAKDRAGCFTLVNKAIADAYGTTVDYLIGKTDADFNPNRDEVDFIRSKDLDVMDSLQERFIPEEKVKDAAGNVRWLQTVKRPILDETGQAVMVLSVATDITERKRVEETLRRREHDLQQAVRERERISEDLHDGILQSIYAIGLGLEACKPLISNQPKKSAKKLKTEIQRTIGHLNHVLEEVRNFIAGLESHILDGQEFDVVLRTMVNTLADSYSIPARVTVEKAAAQHLSTEQAYHVMHVAREALSNSFRHSQASRIRLSLRQLRCSIRLSVTDNGVGFNPTGAHDVGHGLANMAARARKIGGRFALQSKPSQGATVLVDIPRRLADADN